MELQLRMTTTSALLPPILSTVALLAMGLLATRATAAPCSEAMIAEVLQPATEKQRAVHVRCDLTLQETDIVTKRLLFIGLGSSNRIIDCKGATLDGGKNRPNAGLDMIEIRSHQRKDNTWAVPSDIRIRNCRINGSARVFGMGKNGEAENIRESSLQPDHVTRLRERAPSNIHFENITLNATGRIPFYLSPGVHDVTLTRSKILGESVSVGIYLDAESTRNHITHNDIRVTTTRREQIAVDGSSHNTISNNYFGSLSNGGIYLYRNCGEGGTIRYNGPTHNLIQNNSFYYKNYSPWWEWLLGKEPAIYLGSRNGKRLYCGEDKGYELGSSQSDLDYAHQNIIVQNKVFTLDPDMMFVEGAGTDSPNYFFANRQVSERIEEPNGCILRNNDSPKFLTDGEMYKEKTCRDGVMK